MGKKRDERKRLNSEEPCSNSIIQDDSDWGKTETTGTNRSRTNENDADNPEEFILNRRSYLMAAGAATAAIAGCASDSTGYSTNIQAVSGFGYGGAPALQQPSSIEVSVGESEPNDKKQEATVIEFGSTASGSLTQADVDWFAFEVTEGDQINVTLVRSGAEGVSAVVLYDTTGDFTNLRYVGTDEPVSFSESAETSGTHFVQVVDTQSSDGDYTLTVAPNESEQTDTPTPTPTETPTPTSTPDDGQSPYNGEVSSIPGRIQAEDFDVGGEGVAYHDTTSESEGVYRTEEAVGVQETTDTDGGYNVGWIRDGEWLEYTTSVSPGTYDVHFRIASPTSDQSMQIAALIEGTQLGTVDVPNTGDWQNWKTVTVSDVKIDIDQTANLRLEFISGRFNLNWIEFEQKNQTETLTPTESETITPTPTPDDDYGERGYGEDGYGGVS